MLCISIYAVMATENYSCIPSGNGLNKFTLHEFKLVACHEIKLWKKLKIVMH